MKENDLSVAGPGTPISLKKFRELKRKEGEQEKPLTIMVDGTGNGIWKDDPELFYITPQECSDQAISFLKNHFDGKRVPAYLYRYLSYMFLDEEFIKNDKLLLDKFLDGTITQQSDSYIYIKNLITYCEANPEARQVIGLIQLISGCLRLAKINNTQLSIYLEHPECSLHPKRCSRAMSLIHHLFEEYGDGLN
jgi:hypothetical protein